jgi:hypothetical protein
MTTTRLRRANRALVAAERRITELEAERDRLEAERDLLKASGIDWSLVRCRFNGHAQAVALVALSHGCACYPEDRLQPLCPQHILSSEPLGSFQVVAHCADEIAGVDPPAVVEDGSGQSVSRTPDPSELGVSTR